MLGSYKVNDMTTQAKLTTKVMAKFEGEFRNVLALQRLSVPELWKRIGAVIELDEGMKGELEMRAGGIDQKNYYARNVEQDSFVKCLFAASCSAFHTLQERGVIVFATALTQEAERELENLEIAGGIAPPRPILPPAKTAAELLNEEVLLDFAGDAKSGRRPISTDKMREKCRSNRAYRDAYNRLAETNQLHLQATQNHDLKDVGN